jgi:UDP-N-acetylmuramoyl-L-alanyl-D-glutamate--2,6-diaminopimelate ligase
MRKLRDILDNAGAVNVMGRTDIDIVSLQFDSRKVEKGCLFFAIRGTTSDGHAYIGQAISSGASAVVCESFPAITDEHTTYIIVNNPALALAFIASDFYGNPSSKLNLIGITGTNGKTTSATLLWRLFMELGYGAGLLSTIVNKVNETEIPATHTTPDPVSINALLSRMVHEGCEYCFMEVSSHAVDQHRIAGLTFRGGVFTNLTHDHLDYHKTFDAYLKAKKAFFDSLPSTAFALVNKDDRNGPVMLQNTRAWKYTYSLQAMADFRCRILDNTFQGLHLNLDGEEVWCRLIGMFNAYNLLLVYGTALNLGQDKTEVLTLLSRMDAVNGRFNPIRSAADVTAIVDYAHTPDALKNVLETINTIRAHNEQLITVVGAGGNRDTTKRPVMASIACNLSDRVILTSDNPRFEEPEAILADMQKGVEMHQAKKVLVIADRREAIRTACALAQKGDIILVAGKGHETYQEIKGVKHHFDDREIIGELFSETETPNP